MVAEPEGMITNTSSLKILVKKPNIVAEIIPIFQAVVIPIFRLSMDRTDVVYKRKCLLIIYLGRLYS